MELTIHVNNCQNYNDQFILKQNTIHDELGLLPWNPCLHFNVYCKYAHNCKQMSMNHLNKFFYFKIIQLDALHFRNCNPNYSRNCYNRYINCVLLVMKYIVYNKDNPLMKLNKYHNNIMFTVKSDQSNRPSSLRYKTGMPLK